MAPKKQATKGQKQIFEENKSTLDFYAKVMISVEVTYIIFRFTFFNYNSSWFSWVILSMATVLYFACYKFMESLARPTYGESGALIDGGMDLNCGSGTAEHVKDLILLTAIVQCLGIFTDYMWLLMLLAPCRAMYLLWVYILAPWIFAPADETPVDKKKQKKMERKMKRAGMM
ncbi:PREDICTED: transmembrane protein 208-like [Acropora digitifera]|uniref:transmembrane protein 208-like n=1 Tax=Acropora digitifera TaxID=70779 RepID=UPI00077ADC1A|nr:PREDICTED: transmembrane protein 208-like [Acropora digitifera]XP_015774040.1 PREDICTED: transmembrane protein 208-like [Acropora digitifera]